MDYKGVFVDRSEIGVNVLSEGVVVVDKESKVYFGFFLVVLRFFFLLK